MPCLVLLWTTDPDKTHFLTQSQAKPCVSMIHSTWTQNVAALAMQARNVPDNNEWGAKP